MAGAFWVRQRAKYVPYAVANFLKSLGADYECYASIGRYQAKYAP